MSDINIPGVTNSKIDTQKMIKAIMDAKRAPLKRMESEADAFKKRKGVWQDLNVEITKLKDSANGLYSFDSPFSSRKAISSDESVVTAVPTRKAVVSDSKLRVKRIATADRFMSRSVDKDFTVKEGTYRFKVGDKEITLSFHGGGLSEFADAVNKKGGSYLRASVVNDTSTSSVLVIESLHTGEKNKLVLADDALTLAEETGMMKRVPASSLTVPLSTESVKRAEGTRGTGRFQIENSTLNVPPRTNLSIPINPPFPLTSAMVLEYEIKSTPLTEEAARTETLPEPVVPETGGIDYKGIHIESEKSIVILPEEQQPEPPKRVDNMSVLAYTSRGSVKTLPDVADAPDFVKVTVPIGDGNQSLDSILIDNTNTHRTISLRNVRVVDPTVRGGYAPNNPLSEARDAIVEYNGVDVVRDTNSIDDLIPEVTLNLHTASDKDVTLSVKYDTEAMKSAIIGFVGTYDRLLTNIDILTRADESIVDKAVFLSDAEKEKAMDRLALLKGDVTLMQLKSNLQTIMMNSYKTSGGQQMALLAQIGISTSGINTGAIDRTTLRGYLQIDEAKLDNALATKPELVKELFGYDRDRDLIVDTGVAFTVDSYVKPYVRIGGVIATRLQTINTQLTRKNREMTDFKKRMDDYERQLKLKYGKMEGAIEELQKSTQGLNNLNQQNK
ncbi:MAG: flagellar filament capping protein FliD [Spirochaetales bacterium]|nr:flagellar filament capping protein FliD [Spirochaetales bacterium]